MSSSDDDAGLAFNVNNTKLKEAVFYKSGLQVGRHNKALAVGRAKSRAPLKRSVGRPRGRQ